MQNCSLRFSWEADATKVAFAPEKVSHPWFKSTGQVYFMPALSEFKTKKVYFRSKTKKTYLTKSFPLDFDKKNLKKFK